MSQSPEMFQSLGNFGQRNIKTGMFRSEDWMWCINIEVCSCRSLTECCWWVWWGGLHSSLYWGLQNIFPGQTGLYYWWEISGRREGEGRVCVCLNINITLQSWLSQSSCSCGGLHCCWTCQLNTRSSPPTGSRKAEKAPGLSVENTEHRTPSSSRHSNTSPECNLFG